MAILTTFVAAEEDELEAVGESLDPADEWSGISFRDLTIPQIATLHSLLTGEYFDDAIILYDPVYVSAAEGALVLRVADRAIERLVEIDDEALEAIASELTATEEFENAGREEDEVVEMLSGIVDLARLAESQGQILFVWIHPLRT